MRQGLRLELVQDGRGCPSILPDSHEDLLTVRKDLQSLEPIAAGVCAFAGGEIKAQMVPPAHYLAALKTPAVQGFIHVRAQGSGCKASAVLCYEHYAWRVWAGCYNATCAGGDLTFACNGIEDFAHGWEDARRWDARAPARVVGTPRWAVKSAPQLIHRATGWCGSLVQIML